MSGHGAPVRATLASLDRSPAAKRRAVAAVAPRTRMRALAADDAAPAAEAVIAATPNARNFGMAGAAGAQDIYSGLEKPWDTQVMFAKLVRRMAGTYRFPDGTRADNANNFNPKIPAGYTYLAQFAAHDIIRSSSMLGSLRSTERGNRNLRERALMLDALYGDGPIFSELLYELPRKNEGFRTMLRTGSIVAPLPNAPPNPPGTCPYAYRDIPRFQQSDLSDQAPPTGRPDILIPDQRNDDNAVVAQVTALFHHVHNAVASALRARPDMPTFDQEGPIGLHLFENARRVTSALYRQVVREDLLSRLIIKPIWDRYVANGFKPLVNSRANGIPVEFSHAAFRLGHSMVRMSYVFNNDHAQGEGVRDVLKTRSAVRPHKFPPATNWIADWSKFFEIDDHIAPQPGRRIGPCFNEVLLDDGLFTNSLVSPQGGDQLSAEDKAKLPDRSRSGLLLRDLIRGTIGGLLTLDAVLKAVPQDVRDASPLLADPTARAQALRKWLSGSPVVFSDAELDHLSTNPPLIVWLLFEAAEEANGCSLGTLGSIIVADVFLAQLADSRDDIEDDPRTTALLTLLFPEKSPSSMPDLILFTAKALGLEKAVPTFISAAN